MRMTLIILYRSECINDRETITMHDNGLGAFVFSFMTIKLFVLGKVLPLYTQTLFLLMIIYFYFIL